MNIYFEKQTKKSKAPQVIRYIVIGICAFPVIWAWTKIIVAEVWG